MMNPMAMQGGYGGGDFGPGAGGYNGGAWNQGWNGNMDYNQGGTGAMRNAASGGPGYHSAASSAGGYNHQQPANSAHQASMNQVPPSAQFQNNPQRQQQPPQQQQQSGSAGGDASEQEQAGVQPLKEQQQKDDQTEAAREDVPPPHDDEESKTGTAVEGATEPTGEQFTEQLKQIEETVAAVKSTTSEAGEQSAASPAVDISNKEAPSVPNPTTAAGAALLNSAASEAVVPTAPTAIASAAAAPLYPAAGTPYIDPTTGYPSYPSQDMSHMNGPNGYVEDPYTAAYPMHGMSMHMGMMPTGPGHHMNGPMGNAYRGGPGGFRGGGPGYRGRGGPFVPGRGGMGMNAMTHQMQQQTQIQPPGFGKGVEGAPAAPKAMREGRPNRSQLLARGGGSFGRGRGGAGMVDGYGAAAGWNRRYGY